MSEHIAALEAAATVDSVWHCTLVGKRDLIAVLAELQRLRAENETFRQRYVTQTAYDAVKEELAAVRVENETRTKCLFQMQEAAKDLARQVDGLRAENEALRKFAQSAMTAWPHGDLDGGELQEAAIEAGLLEPVTVNKPCRDEGCMCAEVVSAEELAEGVVCYRRTALLKGAAQAAKERTS